MGFFDKSIYSIKQDSITFGLTLFYITAFILIVLNRDKYGSSSSSSKLIIEKENDKSTIEEKIEDNTIVSNTTANSNATNHTPIIVAASPIKVESDANQFMFELKKGLPIIRVKGNKEKKKIMIMNDNYKLSIRAITNNFLSSMKKVKQWEFSSIDSIVINEKKLNSFSLYFKEGRLVYKYEILAESDSQCQYLVDGLMAIKEFEGKETEAVLGIMSPTTM